MRAVVTGAGRGIGLELVRQLVARGDQVDAGVRTPSRALEALRSTSNVRVHPLDVTDPDSVKAFAASVGDSPIDIVFNVAGSGGGARTGLRELAEDLALREVAETYEVNALGPLRVTLALLPMVRRGGGKKLVHLTSGMGSIADNTSGSHYAYRMSKAALNMMSKSLAVDLRGEGIISIVVNPGWVQTDMGGPSAPTPVTDSVRGILSVTDAATLADSGEFLNWKGNRYPW
jgi:NAD(P)-dependent dehydrogenase (short-subunit alcohol dehydrogenase family)